jgi:hypothetical protein
MNRIQQTHDSCVHLGFELLLGTKWSIPNAISKRAFNPGLNGNKDVSDQLHGLHREVGLCFKVKKS